MTFARLGVTLSAMPKRSSKKPRREDEAQAAVRIMNTIAERSESDTPKVVPSVTDEDPMTSKRVTKQPKKKNPAAVALGRLGGLVGGKARAEKLSPKKRSEIAKAAARARWKK